MKNNQYNDTQIEQWGVDTVANRLSETSTLRRFLKENDKTPLWDGEVLIYKDSNWENENIIGKVSVQLKGKLATGKELAKDSISYSVEIVALTNYQKNFGTIYFVTLINEHNTLQKTIYYETLTPRKISGYIKGKEHQKTCTIKLKKLPEDKFEIQSIFYKFYKESSFGNVGSISLDKLLSIKDVKITGSIFKYIAEGDKTSIIDVLLSNDLLWTAEFPNHPTPIPIDLDVKTELSIIQKEELSPIIVNGEIYNNYYSIDRNKNRTIYKFGKSTTLEIPKDLKGVKIKYSSSDMLSERIRDFKFFINLIETNELQFKGKAPLILGEIKSSKPFELEEAKKELDFYRSVDEFWKSIKVNDDFNIGKIDSNSSLIELDILMNSINGNKTLYITTLGEERIYLFKKDISNFKILLFLEAVEQEKCTYKVYNYFDYKNNFYAIVEGTHIFTSRYTALKSDDYIELNNIDFSDILLSFKDALHLNKNVTVLANYSLLELLLAYDKHIDHSSLILETAQEIADWLLEEDEVLPHEIRVINYLQTIKRKRELSVEENKMLYVISEKSEILMHKVGANLLLDNHNVAQIQFDQLDDEEKELFMSFPIYRFWQ